MLYNNDWGTVCHDSWDDRDATVVCRQLGLPYGSAKAIHETFYGEGSGQIWLDDIRCTGNEDSLDQCQHSRWGIHNCDHSEDAAILCVDGKCFLNQKIHIFGFFRMDQMQSFPELLF